MYFAELLNLLRIADEINAKATIIEKGFIANAVVDGRADVGIQQLSELLFVPGAQIAGPFPAEVQQYTEFSAALALEAVENAEARAFIEFLRPQRPTKPTARPSSKFPSPSCNNHGSRNMRRGWVTKKTATWAHLARRMRPGDSEGTPDTASHGAP
ncbi:molybdate ABC transporter substrate-binding protein [Arthrobacter sp. R-11]|uniref:molybdate ABC transporter substrate-binding protein n=1 Tax=Arthrobacter sp. R-11 TaxID=3404053 RepID=UPI003CF277D0